MKKRKTNRLKNYNYSQAGYYFVTICTKDRIEYFGKVEDGKLILNHLGEIAKKTWQEIPHHFKSILLDEFIVMPNHVHGTLIIEVGNRHACSLPVKRQHQTLPAIIGSYKSAVTKQINQMDHNVCFHWQKSFFDHVIRREESYIRIREYIINNPLKWGIDIENRNRITSTTLKDYYEKIIEGI